MPSTPQQSLPPRILRQRELCQRMIAVMKRFMQKGLGRQMITITDPLGRTQPRWDHCLTPEFYKSILPEERFRVAESNLLLDESNPTAGDKDVLGFLFIRPISHDQMQDWLQESKPWLSGAFHSPPTLSAEDTDERHRAAECLGGSMLGWLSNSEYDEFYHTAGTPPPRTVGIMEGKTKFSWSPKHFGFQSPPQENIINGTWFSTEWILDYDDGRYPHSVAYMASNLPLNEKYLLAGEVLTIFHLTFHRFVCNLAKANPVVPITLISASNHDVRLLHAFVDDQNSCVHVRKSKIFNFDQGIFEKKGGRVREDWTNLLRWVIGTPDLKSVSEMEARLGSGGVQAQAAAQPVINSVRAKPCTL
ncbi:hypothetical protein RB601_000513 [Gaeumannomyces tritici]